MRPSTVLMVLAFAVWCAALFLVPRNVPRDARPAHWFLLCLVMAAWVLAWAAYIRATGA